MLFLVLLLVVYSSSKSLKTMVWSGAEDWKNINASIIALASCIPQSAPSDLIKLFTYISTTLPEKSEIEKKDTVVLSVGGSAAQQQMWKAMEASGPQAWAKVFVALRNATGMNGIDWDLENCPPEGDSFWDFVGDLSKTLKVFGFTITFTIFGNVNNPQFPPTSFMSKYSGDAFVDNFVIMLYDNRMWKGWKDYAMEYVHKFPATVSKLLFALFPADGQKKMLSPQNFDYGCVNDSCSMIEDGDCVGVAFWCYGGYLGACVHYNTEVKQCLDTLNAKGTQQSNCQ